MAKQVKPLTDVRIRNTKPKDKMQTLFDGGGLYLAVMPSGGKLWRMKYRFSGKEGKLSFGAYPDVSLEQARQRREEARKLLANGIDPSEVRKAQKAAKQEREANSFEAVAREWLVLKKKADWTEKTHDRMRGLLESNIFPHIGDKPVADLTAPEFLAVLRRTESRGILETTHKVKNACGQIMRYAVSTGRATSDPVAALREVFPPVRVKHMAAVTEPKQVADMLRQLWGYKGSFTVACALKIAPYVFVRPGELRHMRWQDINFDTVEWRYTVSKTKTEHIVPLARQVVTLLKEIQPLTGHGKYVFPSPRTGERPMSDNAILSAFRRMGIAKEEMTGHGFRAMARTILDEVLGERIDLIEHQLAHAVRDPLGRAYNRTKHLPERKRMMQHWADYLDGLRTGKVIPFQPKAASGI